MRKINLEVRKINLEVRKINLEVRKMGTAPVVQWLSRSLGREDPLEKEMAIHSNTIAWKIPWTKELGNLQSMGLQRVRHD